jgi:hypothetical protein
VAPLTIPPNLARDIAASGSEERQDWLADRQRTITALSDRWSLTVGEPYLPGGCCAWVAPAPVEPRDDPPRRVASDGGAPAGGPGFPARGAGVGPGWLFARSVIESLEVPTLAALAHQLAAGACS